MDECSHRHLVVLASSPNRLRCRTCHLTLKPEELAHGYCPECFEATGQKRDDFEEVLVQGDSPSRYRCEDCGAMLTPLER